MPNTCLANPQLHLVQHIKKYHKNISRNETLMMTGSVKKVGQAPGAAAASQKPKGVPTIDTLFREEVKRQQQPPKAAVLPEVAKGTWSDPRFDLTHP